MHRHDDRSAALGVKITRCRCLQKQIFWGRRKFPPLRKRLILGCCCCCCCRVFLFPEPISFDGWCGSRLPLLLILNVADGSVAPRHTAFPRCNPKEGGGLFAGSGKPVTVSRSSSSQVSDPANNDLRSHHGRATGDLSNLLR